MFRIYLNETVVEVTAKALRALQKQGALIAFIL